MKLFPFLFSALLVPGLFAQGTISVQEPIHAVSPLVLGSDGVTLSCPTCGTGGGGGSSSGLLPWNPSAATPPALSSWTSINGGGNGSFADVTNGVLINSPSGNNIKALTLAAPGTVGSAFTMTVHQNAICSSPSGQAPEYGVAIGDTGSKLITFGFRGAGGPDVNHWNDPTQASGFGSQPFSGVALVQTPDIWFRVKYDGSTLFYQFSGTGNDAASWVTMFQEAATGFLASAPSRIGFYTYSQVTNLPCASTLNYWHVTQP